MLNVRVPRGGIFRRLVGAFVALVFVAGCAAPGGSASGVPTPRNSPRLTPSPSPTSAPVAFRSTVYPYKLSLGGGVLRDVWHPATEVWDGKAPVSHGTPITDYVQIDEGDLFVYGRGWAQGLDAFAELVSENGIRYHHCTSRPRKESLTVAATPGFLYTMTCEGQPVARVVLVRESFGLVVAQLVMGGDPAVQHLIDRLSGFEWTSG